MNAKKASKKAPASVDPTPETDPWYKFWDDNKKISFQFLFGTGGENFRKPGAGSGPGVFRVVSRHGNNSELVGFEVKVSGNDLKAAWEGVSLVPRGSMPVLPVGGKLRKWVDDDSHRIEYGQAVGGLISELHKADTQYQRLEGFFPVTDPNTGSFNIDRVRIVNIPGIVKDGSKLFDLALVVLTLVETNGITSRQDGGGTGPPS